MIGKGYSETSHLGQNPYRPIPRHEGIDLRDETSPVNWINGTIITYGKAKCKMIRSSSDHNRVKDPSHQRQSMTEKIQCLLTYLHLPTHKVSYQTPLHEMIFLQRTCEKRDCFAVLWRLWIMCCKSILFHFICKSKNYPKNGYCQSSLLEIRNNDWCKNHIMLRISCGCKLPSVFGHRSTAYKLGTINGLVPNNEWSELFLEYIKNHDGIFQLLNAFRKK